CALDGFAVRTRGHRREANRGDERDATENQTARAHGDNSGRRGGFLKFSTPGPETAGLALALLTAYRPPPTAYSFSNAASSASWLGAKSSLRTKSQASRAPCWRSMPLSSHSTDS